MSVSIPELKELSLSAIRENSAIVLINKNHEDRASLILDFISHYSDIPLAMIVSPSAKFDRSYQEVKPDIIIHHKMEPWLLGIFLKRQQEMTKKFNIDGSDPRALLILDDV